MIFAFFVNFNRRRQDSDCTELPWSYTRINLLTQSAFECFNIFCWRKGMTLFYYLLLDLKLITQNLCEIRWVKWMNYASIGTTPAFIGNVSRKYCMCGLAFMINCFMQKPYIDINLRQFANLLQHIIVNQ